MKTMITAVLSLFVLASCNDESERLKAANAELRTKLEAAQQSQQKLTFLTQKLMGIKARIKTNVGDIDVMFYPEKAPMTVYGFITRAESGFYTNTYFHRVIEGFMIQGGDPNTKDSNINNDGQGGPIAMIPHEFNDIKHEPGILSTARVSDVNVGAGSQFFIMHKTSPFLDGKYTVFGKVTNGMDIVNKIAEAPVYNASNPKNRMNPKNKQEDGKPNDFPVNKVMIQSIEVIR